MINAVLYARYSSDMQREESIDAQLRAARHYCKHKGYNIIKEYCDEAFSAKTDNRPAYQKMLSDAKTGLFKVVVFHKIDRNARNEYEYYRHKTELQKLGVTFEYVAQSIDSTPEGALMENTLVGFAAYYSRNLGKEVMKGLMENAYKGLFCGGVPPLGYDIVDGKYSINEKEAVIVRIIFKRYLDGMGYGKIIAELNDLGCKSKLGKTFGKNSLYSILRNPRYTGDFVFNKVNVRADGTRNSHSIGENMIVVPDMIPKIISKEDFNAVQEKSAHNKKRPGSFAAKHNFLLSGLLECECGSAMIGRSTTTRGTKYYYYKCGDRDRKCSASNCTNKPIVADELESIVLQEIEKHIFNKKMSEQIIEKISVAYKNRYIKSNEEKFLLAKEYQKVMQRMNKIYEVIENNLEDEYDYERLKIVKDEARQLKVRMEKLEINTDQTLDEKQIRLIIKSYRKMLQQKTEPDEIKALLNVFVDKIFIKESNIVIRLKFDVGLIGAEGRTRTGT